MIEEKIDRYLNEAREDFYLDRKQVSEKLKEIAEKVSNMSLPDPDSDYYDKYRGNAKATLMAIYLEVHKLENAITSILKNYKY